ncbi:MAG: archaellin/type IV pilin N-terminal domain-containing protein [Thermoplasmata archaeon]
MSPIIATILLVAITVIIAAVLYTLLIPLLGHSTTPLQSNFAFGTPTVRTGTGLVGCASGDYCWSVPLQTANGPAPSSMSLYVQNASGYTVSTASWNFTFIDASNHVVAYSPGPQAGSSQGWTAGPGYATNNALTLSMTLWIDSGTTPIHAPPAGCILYAAGQGSWSGSVQASLPYR